MILALDSSASQGSVALCDGAGLVRELTFEAPRGRGGELFNVLQEVLKGSPALDRVVVGLGPGSYNGIRSALSAGWGIAAARGIPVVGISSILALAPGTYCAVGDARRGQFYYAIVRDGRFEIEPCLLTKDELLTADLSLPIYVPGELEFLPQAEIRMPSAARLAELGANAAVESGIPEPLYLKPAHITTPKAKA